MDFKSDKERRENERQQVKDILEEKPRWSRAEKGSREGRGQEL